MNATLPELNRLLLQRLNVVRDRKLSKSKLTPYSKDQKRLGVDSTHIDRAREELLREGFIAAMKSGRSYQLTAAGEEFLRQLPPPPLGYDEYLLPYQKSYLLFLLLKANEQKKSITDICGRIRDKNFRRTMGFCLLETGESILLNRPLVAWLLDSLATKGAVERMEGRAAAVSYRLLDGGRELLGASEQYPTIEFRLRGEELNALLSAAQLAGKALGTSLQVETPKERVRPTDQQILTEFERLKRERYAEDGMVPIHELRRVVADHFGTEAAGHEVLDPLLKDLRRQKQIRLIALGDGGIVTEQQIADSIRGENEIYFMLGSVVHEPVPLG